MPKNVAASVLAKLNNYRREKQEDFQRVLTQYVIQRFLYRLGVSKYRDQFLLKGSWMFVCWNGSLHRPTKDVDMLGYGTFEEEALLSVFRDVLKIEHDDGIVFDLETLSGDDIKKDDLYSGFRVTCVALINRTRAPLQVDIGFGDAVTPGADSVQVDSVIDQPSAELRGYPVYTVVAEKYHAIVALGIANSRMKDFYDVITIMRTMDLELPPLKLAVVNTFKKRNTELADGAEIYSDNFKNDESKATQWNAFLTKNDLQTELTFADVIEEIQRLTSPLHSADADEDTPLLNWRRDQNCWG